MATDDMIWQEMTRELCFPRTWDDILREWNIELPLITLAVLPGIVTFNELLILQPAMHRAFAHTLQLPKLLEGDSYFLLHVVTPDTDKALSEKLVRGWKVTGWDRGRKSDL